MCTFPEPDQDIIFTEGLWQPIVCIKNIFILPGVPGLFAKMFDSWLVAKSNQYSLRPMSRMSLRTDIKESELSESLQNFHDRLAIFDWSIGSYPKLNLNTGDSWVEISIIGPVLSSDQQKEFHKIIQEMKSKYNAVEMKVE
jgi:molybdopterin-biosynthesis enzyme MoeA-like protein